MMSLFFEAFMTSSRFVMSPYTRAAEARCEMLLVLRTRQVMSYSSRSRRRRERRRSSSRRFIKCLPTNPVAPRISIFFIAVALCTRYAAILAHLEVSTRILFE